MDMKILAAICCVFLIREASGIPAGDFLRAITVENCGTSIHARESPDRIVGGSKVKHGLFPWMVSIHEEDEENDNKLRHVCGGSVLNENWIITAAHCIFFTGEPSKYVAYVGLHKQSELNAETVQKIRISKMIVHEDYKDNMKFHNDIALLKTAKPINISGSKGYVNGVCLPTNNIDPTGFAKVTGWGDTTEDGDQSDTLLEVVVPIVDRETCNEAYDDDPEDEFDEVIDTMICAGKARRDSCQYDSGGPLVQTDSEHVATLIGIVSHGQGCGNRRYPGVYTKVAYFRKWIRDRVSE